MTTNLSERFKPEFFEALYGNCPEGYLEVRSGKVIPNETHFIKVNNITTELPVLIEKHIKEKNFFFGVALRKEHGNGTKANCSFLSALYADIDVGTAGHKKKPLFDSFASAYKHIEKIPLKPSIIVNSGHGLHLYWLLSQPLELNSYNISEIEFANKQLGMLFGGDSVNDASRILRIPGTLNIKEQPYLECSIVKLSKELRYNFEDIIHHFQSDTILALPLEKISKEYYSKIFGIFDQSPNDRSSVDQSIIMHLLSKGFTEEQIETVFEIFPTTGKFLERKAKDSKGAGQYLAHSIENAKKYSEETESTKYTVRTNQATRVIRAGDGNSFATNIIPINSKYANSITDDNYFEGNLAKQPFSESSDYSEGDSFSWIESGEEIGYYDRNKRLSNFVIKINKQIGSESDNKSYTTFDGKVLFAETGRQFKQMSASLLASPQKLKEFLHDLCGVDVRFFRHPATLCEAIKSHNMNTEKIQAVDYGFNDNLTEYTTSNCVISASGVVISETPILHSHHWQNNKLTLNHESKYSIDELREIILEKLIPWDEDNVSMLGLAFTFLPFIFPYIKNVAGGKPYMLLTGDSGSGKSTILKFFQRFHGDFESLFAVSSTSTSMEIVGHAMKDSLFGVDDLKLHALSTETKRNNFTTMIQNYSDSTSRNRANVNLEIRDKKNIRGLMMISGEDYVMSEASSLARGIIINVNKKAPNMKGAQELSELSLNFSHFTLHYLQFLFNTVNPAALTQAHKDNLAWLQGISVLEELAGENLPRLINNFALLKTSWDVLGKFLFLNRHESISNEYNMQFYFSLTNVLQDNFDRAHHMKADLKFIDTFWLLVENNHIYICDVKDKNVQPEHKVVGWYKKEEDNSIKLGINLRLVYKIVEDFLRGQGGIGLSFEALQNRLLQSNIIRTVKTGTVTIGQNKQFRGVYWIGDIPYLSIGLDSPIPNSESPKQEEPNYSDIEIDLDRPI